MPSRVSAIKDFPQPRDVKAFQEFLGIMNFYHRFIPNLASILRPVYQVINTSTPRQALVWTNEMTQSFFASKQALAEATMLVHPCTDCPIALTCDASDVAIGTVLEQYAHGRWYPLAFFSRQLRKPEIKYRTFDRELLGVHLATRHFRYMLEGRQFIIYTDQRPLVLAMSKATELQSARQQRHLSAILEFSTDIRHISGKKNVVADCLSRAVTDINAVSLGIDYTAMAAAQTSSADVQAYNKALTNLQITSTKLNDQGPELLCDISTGRARPIVPPDFRRSVFEAVHNLSHPGVKATVKLVSEKFVWHGLRRRLPEYCGYRYLLTIIDRNTRWLESIPIPNITTAECVQALVGGWISRFGIPEDLSSDRGSQFTLALRTEIARRIGVKVHRTTAFHPQANGMVERFHRTLKAALKARLTGNNWVGELPWVLLGLRTALREDLEYSSDTRPQT
ncbi:Pol polyprotein [Plakobranchus ocellatus]|uniref:Pol polyprotein n=1 Tax=Plakobranchus ocellatus TaxID=259542 RepID=A0AAV4B0U7_9GAST|nr:Pol polyprotein [Plakobranchus ocellatus]